MNDNHIFEEKKLKIECRMHFRMKRKKDKYINVITEKKIDFMIDKGVHQKDNVFP